MKKFLVSSLVAASILSMVGAVSAHPHTVEGSGQVLANGASHPGFTEPVDGTFVSSGFDAYADVNHASANSAYGMETAHHGTDQGTPGKADDSFTAYGEQNGTAGTTTDGKIRPYDNSPALQ